MPASAGLVRRAAGAAAHSAVYCSVLIPLGSVALVAIPLGGARATAARWTRVRTGLLGRPALPAGRPTTAGLLGHAVASVLLGIAAVPMLGTLVLAVVRGVCYGFVDRGPYTHSWGGPTLGGAWAAHFLVGVPLVAAASAALVAIAAVHEHLTRALNGARLAVWAVAVTVGSAAAAVALLIAWAHQI